MKTLKNTRGMLTTGLTMIAIAVSQPVVYDLWNGIEMHTNGGIGTGLYLDGTNQVIIRTNFAFQRTTFTLEIPVDNAFTGSGTLFSVPPSVFFGYRIMDYKSDLIQMFAGFSAVAVGSYNFDLYLMVKPSKHFIMLGTLGAANKVLDRVESDSLTIFKITSNPQFAFSTELQGWNTFENWSLSLLIGNKTNSDLPIDVIKTWLDRSYMSIKKQYDGNLRFEVRIGYYKRQLILNYLFNK